MSELLEAALAYARKGWYVFPCEPPRAGDNTSGKRPIGMLAPNGKDDASTNELVIRSWWHAVPDANIGIATKASGLIILDVDIANGKLGAASLQAIDHILEQTLCAQTGSGGLHLVYERGDAEPRQALHIRPGLDLLGNGYFIAAPSKHHSGGTYKWINNTPIARVPLALATMKRERDEKPTTSAPRASNANVPEDAKRVIAAARIASVFPAKGRHNAFFALAGGLATDGWDEDSIAEFCIMVAKLLPYESSEDKAKALADRPLQARDSVSRVQAGLAVEGWGTLSHVIDPGVLREAMDTLGLVDNFDFTSTLASVINLDELGSITPEDIEAERVKLEQAEKGFRLMGEIASIEYPPVVSFASGFPELDKLLGGGFSTQQLIVLLGKPGAGKSAFVIERGITVEPQVPVLYVSTELQHNEIIARAVSPIFGSPWRDIVRNKGLTAEGELITTAMKVRALESKRIACIGQDELYTAGEKALELIARTAIAMRKAYGVAPLIIIDYMQELARSGDTTEKQKNTAVAVAFRMLSQKLDCAIVAVSSTSRAGYNAAGAQLRESDDPTVYLSLAKESGDIDYAAATIAFIDVADERDESGWKLGRIAVAKSRHGEVGFAGVRFHGATGRWQECVDGVAALSGEKQKQSRQERQMNDYKARVVAKVRELTAYGPESLLDKTALKLACGGNASMMGVAIETLCQERVLVKIRQQYPDAMKRMQSRDVIALGEMAAMAVPGPVEPVPSILEILAAGKA